MQLVLSPKRVVLLYIGQTINGIVVIDQGRSQTFIQIVSGPAPLHACPIHFFLPPFRRRVEFPPVSAVPSIQLSSSSTRST